MARSFTRLRPNSSNDSPTPFGPPESARADVREASPREETTPRGREETTRGRPPVWLAIPIGGLERSVGVLHDGAGRREPGADAAGRRSGKGAKARIAAGGTRVAG